ncbi:MAG TPA: malectin domain-containing carbohydrate-binding protein [Tepidisphaeraceae bacterium]|nr:malectin domain-containing carbohydrate-binding protein [Tepidisphaeraceae bacterium]
MLKCRRAALESLESRRLLADVVGLTLINAQTDQPVVDVDLTDGAVIDLAKIGRQLNIRADVSADTKTVRFNYDSSPGYKLEGAAPFAIGGDANNGKDFLPWTPSLGAHALVVTAYTGSNALAGRGGTRTVVFEVIDSSNTGTGTGTGGPAAGTSTVRVNAGGGTYTASAGRVFGADSGFTGGTKSSSVYSVAGTIDDPLYHARRYGASFSFARAVGNGAYTLTLHFAEPTFTQPGQRRFDVSAEGKLLIDDVDLVKSAGAKAALVKSFPVTVVDGQLNVAFASSINNAIISGIELTPAPGGPSAPLPVAAPSPARVNAGGGAAVDSRGRAFQPGDVYFTGGTNISSAYDVLGTPDDPIFSSYRQGASFTFAKPVASGNYALWLEFADPASAAAGERTFDISAEGTLVLNDFDVFAAAGGAAKSAVVRQFNIAVTDGRLDLAFTGVAGSGAIVSAIVLAPTDIPAVMLPYSGIGDYPNSPQREAIRTAWSVRSQSNLRQIGMGMLMYANEHKNKLPPDLATLVREAGVDFALFANPRIPTLPPRGGALSVLEQSAWVAKQDDYVFLQAYKGASYPNNGSQNIILVYENPDTTPSDNLNALYADGHVGVVARADLVALVGGSATAPPEKPRPWQTAIDPKVAASAQNLRDMGEALQIYANENKGKFAPDFATLLLTQDLEASVFINPRGATAAPPAGTREEQAAWANATTDYRFPAAGKSESAVDVVAYENPAEMRDGINILFADGRVEFREMRWALETIAAA